MDDQLRVLLTRLDDRERSVLSAHYGLGRDSAVTYAELGARMGLPKHRVRQIEQAALAKLRKAAQTLGN
jgi:RNA polymerase sigma factor (sigma-70 family)